MVLYYKMNICKLKQRCTILQDKPQKIWLLTILDFLQRETDEQHISYMFCKTFNDIRNDKCAIWGVSRGKQFFYIESYSLIREESI